jgi:hypothetical protein
MMKKKRSERFFLNKEEEVKEEFMRSLIDAGQTDKVESENDSILKINHFLEASLKEGKSLLNLTHILPVFTNISDSD